MARKTLRLKFSEQQSFGEFCVALARDNVPFSLGGHQAIFLDEAVFEQLPAGSPSQKLFNQYKTSNLVQITGVRLGKRHLPTTEEAVELLKSLAQKY